MKVVPLAEAKNALSAMVDAAQHDRILVTRHGRPAAVIVGVEGARIEDVLTQTDDDFWRMIEARRTDSRTVDMKTARARLGVPTRRRTKTRPRP